MRISDWGSDVCSSDLRRAAEGLYPNSHALHRHRPRPGAGQGGTRRRPFGRKVLLRLRDAGARRYAQPRDRDPRGRRLRLRDLRLDLGTDAVARIRKAEPTPRLSVLAIRVTD